MTQRRIAIVSLVFALLVSTLGIFLIAAKSALWSITQDLYALIEVQADRTRLWELFTTTLGLGLVGLGIALIIGAWSRFRNP